MVNSQSKWSKLKQQWDTEGPRGVALWAANWTLWKSRFYYALPGPTAEEVQARFRYAQRTKKYGIEDPIIVYQMGKVGSTTMVHSLLALRLNVPVYHLHFLNESDQVEAWAKDTLIDPKNVLRMVQLSRRLRKSLEGADPVYYNLICLVRAPVPRNISMFFQNIDSYMPDWKERYSNHTLSFDEITTFFLQNFLEDTPNFWFDREVKGVFGLDVYAAPFDKGRGFQIYQNAMARLLVIRLEDLNRVAAVAMQEFLNIPDFRLLPANIGEYNPHGALYKEYLKALRLPDDYIERTNSKPYAQHFYTPQELKASVARWRAPRTLNTVETQ